MSQSGKTFHDLVAGEGERIAFLILSGELKMAQSLISEYEESEPYRNKDDSDLYISVLFFRAWLEQEKYYADIRQGKAEDNSALSSQIEDFVPSSPSQKIMKLLAMRFVDIFDEQRLLTRALEIARKDPSLIRERALACHFLVSIGELLETGKELEQAYECAACMEIVHGTESWQSLYSRIDVGFALNMFDQSQEAWSLARKAILELDRFDDDRRLMVLRAVEECLHYIPSAERFAYDALSRRVLEACASPDNRFWKEGLVSVPDNVLLQDGIEKEMEKGRPHRSLLTVFVNNRCFRDDDQIIASLLLLIPVFEEEYEPDSEEIGRFLLAFKYSCKDLSVKDRLMSWLLDHASSFGPDSGEKEVKALCALLEELPGEDALAVYDCLAKCIPSGIRNHIALMHSYGQCFFDLGKCAQMKQCYEAMTKDYDSLGLEKDVTYWKVYCSIASQYIQEGNENRGIRYLRRALAGLDGLLEPEDPLIIEVLGRIADFYMNRNTAESMYDSVVAMYDRLAAYHEKNIEKDFIPFFKVMMQKTGYQTAMRNFPGYFEDIAHLRECLMRSHGDNRFLRSVVDMEYGKALFLTKQFEEAIAVIEPCIDDLEDDNERLLEARSTLLMLYFRTGRKEKSYPLARMLRPMEKKLDDAGRATIYMVLAQMYDECGDWKSYEKMRRLAGRNIPVEALKELGVLDDSGSYTLPPGINI